ncbi:MAG: NADH-quinone oxidoreductase subunit N [Bacteroidales bacterium]|jgi:NADH-quinone oxidoreductase subunit N|nr:NADH-quinone oxidoreductase subunit N [Bacteroidales bacterium]
MDFGNFLIMRQEVGLMLIFLIMLVLDIFASEKSCIRKYFQPVACILFLVHTVFGFLFPSEGTAFGGLYVTSSLTTWMKHILDLGVLFMFLQSGSWLHSTDALKRRAGEFYVISLATLLGMYIMVSAGNLMMLYIGIETASLPMAILAAYNKYQHKSAEAGAKYIMLTSFSSGIMLFGISFLYAAAGTLYYGDINLTDGNFFTITGLVFFLSGLGFKISLVPFHLWTADVYEGAPTSITAFLSVASKAAACFALIFALYQAFGSLVTAWKPVLWWLIVITITLGNIFALRQKDIKRFFAFSSISQAGYIMLGVISGTSQGMTAVVYYLLVYLFANMAAFGIISAVENKTGRTDFGVYNGLGKTSPVLAFVMMLAVFSLAGIPPLGGFFSKFFLFAAAAQQGEYLLVFIALLNTVISLYYYLLVVRAMYIRPAEENAEKVNADTYNKISLLVCTVALIAVGIASFIYTNIDALSFGIR